MKFRNHFTISLLIMILLMAASPAIAAKSISILTRDCVSQNESTEVTWSVSGSAPTKCEFKLYCGNSLIANLSDCSANNSLSIPGKLLSNRASRYG